MVEKIVYFLNPSGKVLKDSSIKLIITHLLKDEQKCKMHYRAGAIVNTPSKLLNELNNLKVSWDVIIVKDDVEIHLLRDTNKYRFLQKLSVSDDSMLTGEIALEFV